MLSGRLLSYLKKRKINRNGHSLSFVVTRCHSLYHSLSLVVIRCHSFTTRCHSLSLDVPLVCLFLNDLIETWNENYFFWLIIHEKKYFIISQVRYTAIIFQKYWYCLNIFEICVRVTGTLQRRKISYWCFDISKEFQFNGWRKCFNIKFRQYWCIWNTFSVDCDFQANVSHFVI